MAYQVFARKWRPQTFQEVVGQRVVTQTLRNALSSERIAHAFLFSGPRGVGKTTTARVLAKALNCERGVSPEPCNVCASCQDITGGRHLDVIEVDGASNRGIDEIRELRENVRFSPYRGRHKVIVIDEVHMLTDPAFNALLKTLEEPPPRVVFVLATTEPHKVPATILSRCQRFEFRRIPLSEIVERLREMGKEEGIEIAGEAMEMIARSADGSLRDAQSLLDQVVSYSGARVSPEDVETVLGVVDRRAVEEAAGHILAGEGTALLELVQGLSDAGHDLRLFGMSLLELVRDLMILRAADSPDSLMVGASVPEVLRGQARQLSFPELDRLLQILMQAELDMRRSPYPRFVLEMAFLRMVEGRKLASVDQVWERLCRMEERLASRAQGACEEAMISTEANARPRMQPPVEHKGPSSRPAPEEGREPGEKGSNWMEDPRWMDLKRVVRREKVSLAPLLDYFQSACLQGNVLQIQVEAANSYLAEALEDQGNRRILEGAAQTAFAQDIRLRFEFGKKGDKGRDPSPPRGPDAAPVPAVSPPSLVEQALELFEGRVVNGR